MNAPRQAELTITNGYECKGPVRKANDISTERSVLLGERKERRRDEAAGQKQMDGILDRQTARRHGCRESVNRWRMFVQGKRTTSSVRLMHLFRSGVKVALFMDSKSPDL